MIHIAQPPMTNMQRVEVVDPGELVVCAPATESGPVSNDGVRATGLTAEGLLLFCQTQLNSLDNEINDMLDEQIKNLARKDALATVENKMKEYTPPSSAKAWDEIAAAYNEAIDSLPEGDPTREALIAKKEEITFTYGPEGLDRGPKKNEWQAHIGDIRQQVDNLKGDSEIVMIRLQSTISQRQTAVQLTTNVLSKVHQTLQSITANLKG